jgi:hemerythrin-like domain-containing protein
MPHRPRLSGTAPPDLQAIRSRNPPLPKPLPGRSFKEAMMATRQAERTSGPENATGAFVGAAAGFAAGLFVGLARKVAVQAPTILAGEWDEALAAEHKAVIKIFDALEQTTEKDVSKRTVLLTQMKHALGKHALQEENAVYATLRDKGMKEGADHLNHEHGYVKQFLFELTELSRSDALWLPKLREFRTLIEEHVREEEQDLFPKLKAQLSADENKHLTTMMNREGLKLA